MKKICDKLVSAAATVLIILLLSPVCIAQQNPISYQLLANPDSKVTYELNVYIPEQLNEYFATQNHRLSSSKDFIKFVTPYALRPIADSLWQIYDTEEEFANGVLMIVHQMPYEETTPGKYSIETMIANVGDCDLFAYIASSIMMAGGLDVVLFYYESQGHMNVGVRLSHEPTESRGQNYYVEHDGEKYYVAECTGGNWKSGWRIGECPSDYQNVTTKVISLESQKSIVYPGQVSANFNLMESSNMALAVSPFLILFDGTLTIQGQITPALFNQNITLYASINNSPWEVIGSALTQKDGSFSTSLQFQKAGLCTIAASWIGSSQYAGTVSEAKSVIILPYYFLLTLIVTIIIISIGIVVYCKTKPDLKQPQPSEFAPQELG